MVSDCLLNCEGPNPIFIVVYVDDLLVIGSSKSIEEVKKKLSKLFSVIDLGPCTCFLGMNIIRKPNGIFISQNSYTERLIEAAGMFDCNPTRSPLPLHHPLYEERKPSTEVEQLKIQDKLYRSILGSLLYLSTRTRPYI